MEQSVTTRLGDGSLVRMTPSEIRADLEEATALGAKKAKAEPLEADELEQLLEIFASNAKFTAVDVGDELILSCDGSGNLDSGTRLDELYSYQSHRGADIIELYHIDYSYKAIKTILSFETQTMKNGAAQPGGAAAVRRHARPGALLAARRPGGRTGPSSCRWAASTKPGRPRKRPWNTPCTTWSSSPRA